MDLRRGFQHEYGRSRGADGGGYGAPASSSGRAVPPTAVPSLSTGQGFYTVESLQGATMVPPPQPAPPPPRLLPPVEPYTRDPAPPRRLHPADRADFGPYERRYPLPPAPVARKMMMSPPQDLRYLRRGEGLRGPGMLPHRPPPLPHFMGEPHRPGFFPGRNEPPFRGPWGPDEFEIDRRRALRERHRLEHGNRPNQRKRMKAKKREQNVKQHVAAERRSLADDKQNPVEGGPGWCAVCKIDCLTADSLNTHMDGRKHKKQADSQGRVEKSNDKSQEVKEEDGAMAPASQEVATVIKEDESGEAIAVKEGELDPKSVENMDVAAPQVDCKSEATELKSIAGKKRAVKDSVTPKKKPRKSAVSSDASNAATATAVKGAEDATNADEVLQTRDFANAKVITLGEHVKGADDVSTLKISAFSLQAEGDGNDPPATEMKLDGGDGLKEVRGVTDLKSGRTEQSAEVQ